MTHKMTSTQRLAHLERRIDRLERQVIPWKERKATIRDVRKAFVQRLNRDGQIDYLQFWRDTRYPYDLVEQVVRELEDKRLIEDAD